MKWILGLCAVALVVGGLATITLPAQTIQPDEATLKLLPVETSGVASIDVAGLRSNLLVQALIQQRGYPPEVKQFIEATGFQPDRDIHKVTVARIGRGRVVGIIDAQYDHFKIEQFLQDKHASSETYLGRVLYSSLAQGPTSVTFIDNLIVGGNTEAVKQVIDRMAAPAQNATQNLDLMGMIRNVETGNQVWAVGTVDRELLRNAPPAVPPQLIAVIGALTMGSYQMRIDQDVHAKAIGTFSNNDAAKNTADLLRGLLGLVKLQGAQKPSDFSQVIDGIRIDNSNSNLTIQLDASGDLLKKLPARKVGE